MFKKNKKEETFRVHDLDFADLKKHKRKIIIVYNMDFDRFKIFYDKEKAFTYLKNQYKQASAWTDYEEETYKITKAGIIELGEDINLAVTFKTIEMECSTYGKN